MIKIFLQAELQPTTAILQVIKAVKMLLCLFSLLSKGAKNSKFEYFIKPTLKDESAKSQHYHRQNESLLSLH